MSMPACPPCRYAYDLSSLAQTRSFAAHVRADVQRYFGGRLHHLINNAGVFEEELHRTEVRCALCLARQLALTLGSGVWVWLWN